MAMDEDKSIPKKIDKTGRAYYGETFERYQRVGELTELLPQFKEYYYQKRINSDLKHGMTMEIIHDFLKEVVFPQGKIFFPHTNQIRTWVKKWDADILATKAGVMAEESALVPRQTLRQVVKTRGEAGELLAPGENTIEDGVRTLGGELINDAFFMLQNEQNNPNSEEGELSIKRRNYVVNVFSHATKLVHGKAALMLKASEEKRNTAGFLMSLLSKATAGTITDAEVDVLEAAYIPHDTQPIPEAVA